MRFGIMQKGRFFGLKNINYYFLNLISITIRVFVIIIAIECNIVAILYEPIVNNIKICLRTLVPNSNGDSVPGCL